MNLSRHINRISAPFPQRGLASVELVLIAPILALFMYFMFQSLKSAYVWEDRIIGARNAAWKAELYGLPGGPDLGGLARAALEGKLASKIANPGDIENIHDINVVSYSKLEGVKATEAFHDTARRNVRAGNADVKKWTGILDEDDNKFNVTSGTSQSWFVSILGKYAISEPTIAETTHYVDFERGWENKDEGMKVGYDVALKKKLKPVAFYKGAIK